MTTVPAFPMDTDLLLSAFDQLNVGVYVTDLDRQIILWNRKAEQITGYPASAVVGMACHENVLVHVDKDGHELCHSGHCPLYRAMEVGRASTTPVLVYAQTASGRRVAVSVSVAPLRNTSGQVVGGIELFHDETEQLHDLEFAQRIQKSQLPASIPETDALKFDVRYYPFGLVGGDFYDVRQVSEDQYGILLADVSGHGISAALYTMQLRTIAEDCWQVGADPAAFLAKANHALSAFALDEIFATALYLVIDERSGRVAYASAGHPPPLRLPADGGPSTKLAASGAPLGIIADMEYESVESQFEPGDMLLAYTDGATEVTDAQGGFLGEDGLARFALEERRNGDTDVLKRIYVRIKQACAEVSLADDLTLLSVARRA
jgi:phosphoserine phosphatase RsbU/P